jgi:ribosomal protein L21E
LLEMKKDKKLLLLLVLVLVGALLFVSIPASAGENPGRGKSVAEARKTLEQELLPLAGVVGISHSETDGEITVFVEDEQTKQRMPRSFNGYTVRTEVTGKIQALTTQVTEPLAGVSPKRRGEVSTLVGGISLSAWETDPYYAGTLGMITYNDKILSNAHVIAIEPLTSNFLDLGTDIIQPGSLDGGRGGAKVGELEDYIPIDFAPGAKNYADAAIGSIWGDVGASPGEQFSEGDNYWIEGWTEVSVGDTVRKSGRTTGVTIGQVNSTDCDAWVWYGDQKAHFVDLIRVDQDNWSFAEAGDSGSAVDKDGEFVGLVFASTDNGKYVFINKAWHIIDGLGIAVEPQYSLTISSTPGGSVTTPGEGMHIYDAETIVDLVAMPEEHYHFVNWTGDVDTIDDFTDPTTTITVDDSYSITASFALDPGWYSLTVSSSEGGSVTPTEGMHVYEGGEEVELVAEPDVDNHYHFGNWTGDVGTVGNVTAAATNITMNASYAITANFDLDEGWYSLTTFSTEGGSVTEPGEGISIHAANTPVDLVAEPSEWSQFLRWTGEVSTVADVNAATTNISMNASYSITATFLTPHPEPVMATLTVSSTEGGSVTTPGVGTFSYPFGIEVSLVAEAASDYQFIYWSGDVSTFADVDDASTTIIMNGDYSITANFGKPGLRCFIATAAYGTPMAGEIGILRKFRDEYLLTNPVGATLVEFYYRVSPPLARFITEHPSLKPIVRAGLLPAVALSAVAVNTTVDSKTIVAVLLVLVSVAVTIWATRRRGRGPEYT